jgi:hypothetical protein
LPSSKKDIPSKKSVHLQQSGIISHNHVSWDEKSHTQITVIIDISEQGYNAAISSWGDMQNHTHTQTTVIIDTSEQGYNAAISSWRDLQNHTHTHIDLARRSSILLHVVIEQAPFLLTT